MLLQNKAQPILQELVNDKKSVLIWQGLVGKLEVISSFWENKVVVEQTQCIFTKNFLISKLSSYSYNFKEGLLLKLRHCEKATKLEKNLPLDKIAVFTQ